MRVALIVAMGLNRVIGIDNQMPWHLPEDLKRFRALTIGHPVLMGRRTHESIGRPLPGRKNIVLSRMPGYQAKGCEIARSLEEAKALACSSDDTLFVIGGSELYRLCLPEASLLFLTQIHQSFEGDTYFPAWDPADWIERSREDLQHLDGPHQFDYSFISYERIGPMARSSG